MENVAFHNKKICEHKFARELVLTDLGSGTLREDRSSMPVMDEMECRTRAASVRVARLATTRADRRVDLVPIVFAFVESDLVFAVDHKPKRTADLQRLTNIEVNPEVTVLFDHYVDDDWDGLWWVRMRGWAQVVADGPTAERALDALQSRYPQHAERRPDGRVVVITPTAWTGWGS